MAFDFPTSPTTGQEYLTENGKMYIYDGTGWTTIGDWQTPNRYGDNFFRYRTIYTRGYVACGYASSSPWRNVNKTIHSTDVTTNLGDIMDRNTAYIDGGFSDYYFYIYGATGAVNGSDTFTQSFNMATDVSRGNNSAYYLKTSRSDTAVLMNDTLTAGYITTGGSNSTDKHNFVTDIMYNAGTVGAPGTGGSTAGASSALHGATRGYIMLSGFHSYLSWSNELWVTGGNIITTDGQPKGHSSKYGFGYCTEGSYAGSNYFRKINDSTGAIIGGTISRPSGTAGEENPQIGQNWGYTLGQYNGAQNNLSDKITYSTDTVTAMGSATQPKGHAGMSSAGCGTASAQMLGGQ